MVGLKLRLSGSDAVFRNFKRAMGHPLARPDVFDYYLMEERKKIVSFSCLYATITRLLRILCVLPSFLFSTSMH